MENYEQKYKESLERCKSWMKGEHPECFSEAQKAAEFIFPELRESEDERIRKEIISYIKSSGAVTNPNWIAWLEKQGEQKPTDKIESKSTVWSEDDEAKFRDVIRLVEQGAPVQSIRDHYTDWLKSLKPQNVWISVDEEVYVKEPVLAQKKDNKHNTKEIIDNYELKGGEE